VRTIVPISFAVTKEATSASAAQRSKQVVKTDAHDSRSLNQIHNRTQTLTDRHVGNGKSLMNACFRCDHVGHAIVFETDDGVCGFLQAGEGIASLSGPTFSFKSKWHRRETNDECAHFTCDLRDHGRRAGTRPAAESCANENQA